jgi:hypothetical protein
MDPSQIEQEGAALAALLKAIKPILNPTDSRGQKKKGIVLVDFAPGGDTRLVLVCDQLVWEKKGDIHAGGWEIKDFQELTTEGAVMRFNFAQIVLSLAENLSA